MQGDRVVIQHLNKTLACLLVGINQYFLHAKMLKNMGLSHLASSLYRHSIEEMKAADALSERILILEGLPNVQDLGKLLIGESPLEILQCDLKQEEAKHRVLLAAIASCEDKQDFVSRQLLEEEKEKNEERCDWLATQLEWIAQMGLENYLQSSMK